MDHGNFKRWRKGRWEAKSLLACTQTFYFSFRSFQKHPRAKRARERKIKDFFPHHYLLALAANKSPAIYNLSPAPDGLWRENRGSVASVALDYESARKRLGTRQHADKVSCPRATKGNRLLDPVVQTLDSAIHRINHYPADKYYGNQLLYPLDSDLSGG